MERCQLRLNYYSIFEKETIFILSLNNSGAQMTAKTEKLALGAPEHSAEAVGLC